MLEVKVYAGELYDELNNRFIKELVGTLTLEHSLVSLSKWEKIWEIPFLGSEEKDTPQTLSYIECMSLSGPIPPEVIANISNDNIAEIANYIDRKMTATWFRERKAPPGRKEVITAELIYYWLVALQIDFQVQDWHLNSLLTLVKVCNEKNQPQDKKSRMSKGDQIQQRAALNAERKANLGTSG